MAGKDGMGDCRDGGRDVVGEKAGSVGIRPRVSTVRDPGGIVRRLVCFVEVDAMVREGHLLRRIVLFIREERGEALDISERALMSALFDYRSAILSDDGVLEEGEPARVNSDEPLWIYQLLSRRLVERDRQLDMEEKTERDLNKLFSTTHKELDSIGRLGDKLLSWQDKLGILRADRVGKNRHGSGLPGKVDLAVLAASPESRRRVMSFVETLARDPELLDTISEERKPIQRAEDVRKGGAKRAAKKKQQKKKASQKKSIAKKMKKSSMGKVVAEEGVEERVVVQKSDA